MRPALSCEYKYDAGGAPLHTLTRLMRHCACVRLLYIRHLARSTCTRIKLAKKSQNSLNVFFGDRLLKFSFQSLFADGCLGCRVTLTDVSAAAPAQLACWVHDQMSVRHSHNSHHVPLRKLLLRANAGSHRHMLRPPRLRQLYLFSWFPSQLSLRLHRNRHGACELFEPQAGPDPHQRPMHL